MPLLHREDHNADSDITFDILLPRRHTYLGEVDDLVSTSGNFEAGTECTLPLLALPSVVLMPGGTLPLRLIYQHQIQVVKTAMGASSPHTCLLVVVCQNLLTRGHSIVGSVAEIRQAKCHDDGTVNCMAVGRHRCQMKRMRGARQAEIVLLGDDSCSGIPPEARQGAAYWPKWVHAQLDPETLAAKARQTLADVAPHVKQPKNLSARMMSYWLAETAPLGYRAKQDLLSLKNSTHRLQVLIKMMEKTRVLACRRCGAEVGDVSDLVSMTEAGSGNIFVNAYGYTHDLVTTSHVMNTILEGNPEDEHSWFPGYSWTVCKCMICLDQVGWKFDAKDPSLQPPFFWGIRSQAIRYGTKPIGLFFGQDDLARLQAPV